MTDEPMTSGECAAAVQRVLDRDEGEWDQLGDIVARVTLDVDRRLDADLATAIREIGARNDPSEFGPMSARCDCHVCRPPDLAAGVRFPRT